MVLEALQVFHLLQIALFLEALGTLAKHLLQPKHGQGRLQDLQDQMDDWLTYHLENKPTRNWSSHRGLLEDMQSSVQSSLEPAYIGPLLDRSEELDEYFDEPVPWMTLQPEVPHHWEKGLFAR